MNVRRTVLTSALVVGLCLSAGSVPAAPQTMNLSPLEKLGKAIFFNNISAPDHQSCAGCHGPENGFTGPIPGVNKNGGVYPGAVPQRFGNRKPPSAAYATLAPNFQYDPVEGLFFGGNFWDGRATGDHLGNPAADQALGPFLNPVEQNNASALDVLVQIAGSKYALLWNAAWGEPLLYDTPAQIVMNYDRVGLAIAAYEGSPEVNAFSSKWDLYMNGEVELTEQELWGMDLFNGKGECAACHPAPLFTDFTYDNLGVPRNPMNPFYGMDEVYLDNGQPINPLGENWIDYGLGGYLASLPASWFASLGLDKAETVAENVGKHKVPTLRNVDKRPGAHSPKVYGHNGAFTSLKDIVHFYNTRDVLPWPAPEVADNVNHDELGNLGLTGAEEDAIVAFLCTLNDGYVILPASAPVVQTVAAGTPDGLALRLAEAGPVAVRVFDVRGRLVRDLGTRSLPAGENLIPWDGRDDGGRPVNSGAYFYQVAASGDRVGVKAILRR